MAVTVSSFQNSHQRLNLNNIYKGSLLKWFNYMYVVVIVINVVLVDLVERT